MAIKSQNTFNKYLILAAFLACQLLAWTNGVAAPTRTVQIAPVDSGLFVEMKNLSKLRIALQKDPLVMTAQNLLPIGQQWRQLQDVMQLTGPQLIDRYLGKVVAIIGQKPDNDSPKVIVTQVTSDDAQMLVDRLKMAQTAKRGEFTAYLSQDKKLYVVIGQGWLFLADGKHGDYLESVVTNISKGKSLADDPQFKKWTDRLPADRWFTGFARAPKRKETHALSVSFNDLDMDVRYAGSSPFFKPIIDRVGTAKALDFGPLPTSTYAALLLNSRPLESDDVSKIDQLVGYFLAPKTFSKDLLPGLQPPLVSFAGQVKPSQAEPAVPAIGLAIKLTGADDQVAKDLGTFFDRLAAGAQWAAMHWKTAPVAVGKAQYAKINYQTVQLGQALSQRTKKDQLKHVNLAYGQLGQWYVITTHERLFQQCIDAAQSDQSFATRFSGLEFEEHDRPILTGFVRPQELGTHLQTMFQDIPDIGPKLAIVNVLLGQFDKVSTQVYVGPDQSIGARFQIVRPKQKK